MCRRELSTWGAIQRTITHRQVKFSVLTLGTRLFVTTSGWFCNGGMNGRRSIDESTKFCTRTCFQHHNRKTQSSTISVVVFNTRPSTPHAGQLMSYLNSTFSLASRSGSRANSFGTVFSSPFSLPTALGAELAEWLKGSVLASRTRCHVFRVFGQEI